LPRLPVGLVGRGLRAETVPSEGHGGRHTPRTRVGLPDPRTYHQEISYAPLRLWRLGTCPQCGGDLAKTLLVFKAPVSPRPWAARSGPRSDLTDGSDSGGRVGHSAAGRVPTPRNLGAGPSAFLGSSSVFAGMTSVRIRVPRPPTASGPVNHPHRVPGDRRATVGRRREAHQRRGIPCRGGGGCRGRLSRGGRDRRDGVGHGRERTRPTFHVCWARLVARPQVAVSLTLSPGDGDVSIGQTGSG